MPGNKWNLMHEKSIEVIVEGLLSLKLLKGSKEEVIDKGLYSKFYMHRIGHWLGMDVHDVQTMANKMVIGGHLKRVWL